MKSGIKFVVASRRIYQYELKISYIKAISTENLAIIDFRYVLVIILSSYYRRLYSQSIFWYRTRGTLWFEGLFHLDLLGFALESS